MQDVIAFLATRAGRYEGAGLAHHTRNFTGVLIIDPPLNPATILYRFTATATDGEILHTETACIGRNQAGAIEIVHANNNIPGLQHFRLDTLTHNELTMVHGDLENPNSCREIVRLRFLTDQDVELAYAWAMPGDEMQPQSQTRLARVN